MSDILHDIDVARIHQMRKSGMHANLLILSRECAEKVYGHPSVLRGLSYTGALTYPNSYNGMMICVTTSLDSGFLVASHCQDIPK